MLRGVQLTVRMLPKHSSATCSTCMVLSRYSGAFQLCSLAWVHQVVDQLPLPLMPERSRSAFRRCTCRNVQ